MIAFKDNISGDLSECLHSMAMDHLSPIVRNDRDILQVGQNILDASNSSRKKDKAREKMRSIAKVVKHARELDRTIQTARDLVHPFKFDVVVKSAKKLSGYDEPKQLHTSYSTVLRVGHAMTDLASVKKMSTSSCR